MIATNCPNSLTIKLMLYAMIFLSVVVLFLIILTKKILEAYEDIEVQNKVLKRDLELNAILKHEYIQKILCPHDLLTFNDEHVYSCDKCSMCNKHCKRECWTQYFINKVKEESVEDDGFFFYKKQKKEDTNNANRKK